MKEATPGRPRTEGFHLLEMSRNGKCLETERSGVLAKGRGQGVGVTGKQVRAVLVRVPQRSRTSRTSRTNTEIQKEKAPVIVEVERSPGPLSTRWRAGKPAVCSHGDSLETGSTCQRAGEGRGLSSTQGTLPHLPFRSARAPQVRRAACTDEGMPSARSADPYAHLFPRHPHGHTPKPCFTGCLSLLWPSHVAASH